MDGQGDDASVGTPPELPPPGMEPVEYNTSTPSPRPLQPPGFDGGNAEGGVGDATKGVQGMQVKDGESGVKPDSALREKDFTVGRVLGEGAYSTVHHVTQKGTGEEFAMKIMTKAHIIKEDKIKYVKMERDILNMLEHPFIITLRCTFQDPHSLFYVLEYAPGGELYEHVRRLGSLSYECSKHYGAELLEAIAYMHSKGVLHRDLKPENFLLGSDGHIRVTDFGTATREGIEQQASADDSDGKRKKSFVGTAEYVSPELLQDKPVSRASDIWAFGCILYQFFAGHPPFRADSEYLIFQKILSADYEFPRAFPEDAKDLIQKILVLDPEKRLGCGADGYDEIRQHPFFHGVDWAALPTSSPPALEAFLTSSLSEDSSASADAIRRSSTSTWAQFLEPGESIVYDGEIIKRRKMTAKRRHLVLTSKPRLFYVDVSAMEVKGEIPWVPELGTELKNNKNFVIKVPGRDYFLEDANGNAPVWIKHIKEQRM